VYGGLLATYMYMYEDAGCEVTMPTVTAKSWGVFYVQPGVIGN